MPIPNPPFQQQTYLQQGNKEVLVSWNVVTGATSYKVYRNTTGVTPTLPAAPLATVTEPKYLDAAVVPNTQYYYWVSSVNGSGESTLTAPTPNSIIPVVAGEMSLAQIRLLSQQKADRINSNFVTLPEWNSFINLAADELYDLVTTVF